MSMYQASVPQFRKMLKNLDGWLAAGEAYAKEKGFDPSVLLQSRLAPDQFALLRQVQSACDAAKFAAARLSGKESPKHPDVEQTIEELHARIRTCTAFLDTITERDFEGAEDRAIDIAAAPGMVASGAEYLNALQIPNFYFHVTTAYAILRHNGVPLGKRAFIGGLDVRAKS